MKNIVYQAYDGLYINLTNKCPCDCTFCERNIMDRVGDSDSLWLEHEPSFGEVIDAFNNYDVDKFIEIIFCGFGEPTERFDVLLEIAAYVKKTWNKKLRLNTNGLGSLVNGRNIAPDLSGLIDTVSISLNTPDPKSYLEIVKPKFGEGSFEALLDFAEECTKYVPNVVLSTVETTITKEQEKECAAICERIGARYRIREFEG